MSQNIKRILVYTHNSIGMGHAFRTLAVITGIKHHRPDIDFLVLSGSSIPHLFLSQGIDVVKLPGIKKEVDLPGVPLLPRYLKTIETQAVFEYRKRVILETFEFFSPDVVMVEHYMGGLMNEVLPLIQKKQSEEKLERKWLLVHLSRGICQTFDFNASTADLSAASKAQSTKDIADRFDLIYVFEDPGKASLNQEFLKCIPDINRRIHYLGPIAVKALHELPKRREVINRLGLSDKPIVLITLGRHGPVLEMAERILSTLSRHRHAQDFQIALVIDPYLDRELALALEENGRSRNAQILHFTPNLIDLINVSELVICRAGYNTVNEVLMTGTAALIIPEYHPGSEQECRARLIRRENVKVAQVDEILNGRYNDILENLLYRTKKPCGNNFDKYAIGSRMIQNLEDLASLKRSKPRAHGKDGPLLRMGVS